MNMRKNEIRVAVAEKSVVVRSGIAALLNRNDDFVLHIIEIASPTLLHETLMIQKPDVLIINPQFEVVEDNSLRQWPKGLKTVALLTSAPAKNDLAKYDSAFSIYDTEEALSFILHTLCHANQIVEEPDEQLSRREKEIIVGVVKGRTNKEIADSLSISVNTVLTHRRNIARKLRIHSPAGLTIYAIVNKLVDITDI